MAVKDFIHNQIKIAEIENKIDNVYSALTDLPNAIKMTINWWKVSMFDKGIGRCPKFQRRDNWGENLIINWFESLMGFFNLYAITATIKISKPTINILKSNGNFFSHGLKNTAQAVKMRAPIEEGKGDCLIILNKNKAVHNQIQ